MDNNVENHSWGSKSTEEEGQIISRRKKKTKKTSDANGSRKNQAPSGHASNMHNWKMSSNPLTSPSHTSNFLSISSIRIPGLTYVMLGKFSIYIWK